MTFSSLRGAVVGVVLASAQAWAVDISGTFTASFAGFDQYGVPSVKLDLDLMCALTCPVSAPQLHFGCSGGVGGKFVAAPMETAGYTSAFFGSDPTGINSVTSTSFPVGSAFYVLAKSATCWCGNASGQGGYIDLQTTTVTIPPRVSLLTSSRAGQDTYIGVFARPMGSETVDVHVQGAGVDVVQTLAATKFGTSSSGSAQVIVTPTEIGTLTVTATLQPYGTVSPVATMPIVGDGTTTGGGSGSTGGGSGSGGGGGTSEPGGCTTAPGLALAAAAVLLRRRRAQGAASCSSTSSRIVA